MSNTEERNRRRGKFNVIDAIVLVLILAVAAVAVIRFLPKKSAPAAEENTNAASAMEYTVLCRMVNKAIAESAEKEVGKELMSNGKIVEGCRVISVETEPYYETYLTADGTAEQVESTDFCNLSITIGGDVPYVDHAYLVGSQEVRVGKSHIVKTLALEITGTTVALDGDFETMEAAND